LNFETAEEAKVAVSEMDGKQIEGLSAKGKTLYVSKAEKKEERRMKLVKLYESKRMETQGHNLYVKNFEDGTDEAKLKEIFGKYGNITSLTIMKDDAQKSRGFGFVCFEKAEEASKAQSELHQKVFGSKPLYVNLAQRKDQRVQELEQIHLNRQGLQGLQRQNQFINPQAIYGRQQQFTNYPNQAKPRWGAKNVKGGQKGGKKEREGKEKEEKGRQGKDGKTQKPQTQTDIKYVQNVRNPKQQTQSKPKVQEQKSQDSALSSHLAQMSPRSQKQTLGDHLYPLVLHHQPQLASKITGMLLEMENGDILHLIESTEALVAKIQEAVNVLKQHDEKDKK